MPSPSDNVRTNAVEYPEPTKAGFLFAAVDEQGNASYAWNQATVTEPPAITTVSGTEQTSYVVHIESPTPNAVVYYTTDGSTPTPNSAVWAGDTTVSATTRFAAIAKAPGLVKSDPVTATIRPTKNILSIPAPQSYNSPFLPIRQSSDGGATWTEWPVTPDLTGKIEGYSFQYNYYCFGSGILALSAGSWLSITRDRGVSWNHMFIGKVFKSMASYNGTTYGPYPTNTYPGYANWVHSINGILFLPVSLSSGPLNPNGGLGLYRSVDGITWEFCTISGTASLTSYPSFGYSQGTPRSTGMAYRNGVYVIAVQQYGFLRSTDDGVTWNFIAVSGLNSSVYSLVALPWGFAFNDGGGLMQSLDDGLTWTRKATGSSYGNTICWLKNSKKAVFMTNSDGTQIESTDGVGWTTTKALYDYPYNLYSAASSDDGVDILQYGYGQYNSQTYKLYLTAYLTKYFSTPLAMPAMLPQTDYGYSAPPIVVWTGSYFSLVNVNSMMPARSSDGTSWTSFTKPYDRLYGNLCLDDGAQAQAPVTPTAIPAPTFSVPSGSYPCSSAGADGTYTVTLGVVGYVILFTLDDTVNLDAIDTSVDIANQAWSDGTGFYLTGNGTSCNIKAGQTKTVRALAFAIDGRKSAVVSVTITATQV